MIFLISFYESSSTISIPERARNPCRERATIGTYDRLTVLSVLQQATRHALYNPAGEEKMYEGLSLASSPRTAERYRLNPFKQQMLDKISRAGRDQPGKVA
jgi:hypothetical protein